MKDSSIKLCSDRVITISFEILLLIALIFYTILTFKESRADKFDAATIKAVSKDMGFDYRLEDVKKYKSRAKNYIEIKGWVVETGLDSREADTIKVALKNVKTGVYYYIPTIRKLRKDVTKRFYDGFEYDDSGFEAKLEYGKEINPEENEYEIFIMLNNRAGRKIVKTGCLFNEWIEKNKK